MPFRFDKLRQVRVIINQRKRVEQSQPKVRVVSLAPGSFSGHSNCECGVRLRDRPRGLERTDARKVKH